MPKPGEQLYMTTDASQTGIGASLHRASDKKVIRHFSKQLSADKKRWIPCELECLAIAAGLQSFLPFFRESGCKPIVYTDSKPATMAYQKMQRGAFSSSPRVSTFLHEVINQAEVKFLSGSTNVTADHSSRNPAPCQTKPCQVCIWVNEKEDQVVRKIQPAEVEAILAGNAPLPFKSRQYWRKRQLEGHDLTRVAFHLKYGATPPKQPSYSRVRRYLQPSHGIFLAGDNVLLAPSAKEFSTTPRYVVPQAAINTVISIFHHQFGCLAQTPLLSLLKRHFFAFNLEEAVANYVKSCITCAAKQGKKHTEYPMSSVEPPKYFGEQYASDVIHCEKQRILLLRETATSYTRASLVKNETAKTLEAGLRHLFAQVRPPNAARPGVCRVDNAPAFISLAENKSLQDIGIQLYTKNPANKNGNPVAEKATREFENILVTMHPGGGKITPQTLQFAIAQLNSKPRWSTLSSVELWTGRDMVTGEQLMFDQEDIIKGQRLRREKSHPNHVEPLPNFQPGDIVFANSERSKWKVRDLLSEKTLGTECTDWTDLKIRAE